MLGSLNMRTTVRIDDDLLRAIKDRAHREELSVTKILNDALRAGLFADPGPRRKTRFRQQTYDMGPPLLDITKALSLADRLKDEGH